MCADGRKIRDAQKESTVMRNFFYGISGFTILLFLIVLTVYTFTEVKFYEFPKNSVGVIIHKDSESIFGHHVYVLTPDSTVGQFNCYDILFNNIEVGDSIKNGQIQKNIN